MFRNLSQIILESDEQSVFNSGGGTNEIKDYPGRGEEVDIKERAQKELSEKDKERLTQAARSIIDCYDFDPERESFLFITDAGVVEENPYFVEAIIAELKERTKEPRTNGNFEVIVVPERKKSATPFGEYIGPKMKDRPVLLATSRSSSHSKETGAAVRADISDKSVFDDIINSEVFRETVRKGNSTITPERLVEIGDELPESMYEKLQEFARKRRIRLISITKGKNPYEILTKGAVEESVANLRERANSLNELMRNVERVHITSPSGTDIVMKPRFDRVEMENGDLSKPGSLANYPIGEWSCSPEISSATGIIVVDGPIGGNHNLDLIEKYGPLRIEVENGVMISVNGIPINEIDINKDHYKPEAIDSTEKLIKSFVSYLGLSNNGQNQAFRIAELGIGTNAKACYDKDSKNIGSSEGEKIYGSCHIAFGSNGIYGWAKNDENFNDVDIHCDMILKNGLSMRCTNYDGSEFDLIKDGKTQGY